MYYPEELIEEVRQKNDIVDVISGYIGLQKKGSNYMCCCPFHGEKTPSFSVNRARQIYKCFGCGEGGNVLTFVMKYENCTFPEAMKILADKAGVELPKAEYSEEAKRRETRRQKLLEVNKEAAKFYYYQLRTPRGVKAKEYLDKRRLSEETRKNFGLGFAPVKGEELLAYLHQKGFSDDLIRDVGLAKMDERRGTTTQFWNRVMFPIQDINHRVIGFGGRIMGENDSGPKYLNSPETEIFDKSRNLYGMNYARTARTGNIILCEGYMDVISMHQAGFTQAVASLGTAFTPGQAGLIKKYTKDVLLAYDSDGAGVKAALRAIRILRDAGMSGRIIDMTPYKDPDEFIKNLGQAAFQERIDHAENSFMFEIRMLERDFDMNDPEGKTNFHNQIARRLCDFSEDVERENYIEAVADKYHIGFENLRKLVVNMAAKTGGYAVSAAERPKSGIQSRNKNTPEEHAKKSQRLLLTWLTDYPQLYPKIKNYLSPEDFTEELYSKVARRMFEDIEKNQLNPAGIINMFADDKEQSEAASLFTTKLPELESEQEKEKAFHDILVSVKKNSYEYYSARSGVDISALSKVIEGKKALEELNKTHISLK
ncbi:MAG: DNA primase [Lachnospiraceae bacterium]|nr:DNA primase [Lachnospiraceae bacterium]MBO5146367.1 DNA primase [Lachnospiraceae bacterium]